MLKLWRVMFEFWQWQFAKIGWFVGRRPLAVLGGSLVLVGVFCIGFMNASFMDNVDSLWVPPTSKAMVDQGKFDEYFPTDPFSRLERIIIVPKNSSADMLTTNLLNQTFDFLSDILNLTITSANKSEWKLNDLCSMPIKGGGCVYFSPLSYWKDDRSKMLSRTSEELHEDVLQLLLSGLIPVQQRVVLGCMTKVPNPIYQGDYLVTHVGALIFSFFLDSTAHPIKYIENWEGKLLELLDNNTYPDIQGYASTGVSVSQEISRQSGGDILLLGVSFVLMCVYMVAALTTFRPTLKTRGLLGLCAVLTVVFAIAATLGFTAWFFQYNPLTVQVLPFFMLAIGMDSVFILFTHFHKSLESIPHSPLTDADIHLAMEDAMYRQGASVALTGITKAVAFLGPVIVLHIPALMDFCIVAAIAIFFELILALFAFNACLVLDARRERSNRADIIPCIVLRKGAPASSDAKVAAASSAVPVTPSQQNLISADDRKQQEQDGEPDAEGHVAATNGYASEAAVESKSVCWRADDGISKRDRVRRDGGLIDISAALEHQRHSLLGRFLCLHYVPVIANWIVQVVVISLFAALLGYSIYGCVTINEAMDVRTLITDGTQLYNYLALEESCDTFIGPPMYLVTEGIDYTNVSNQNSLVKLVNNVQNSTWMEPPVYSWFEDFSLRFLPYSQWLPYLNADGLPTSPQVFYSALDDFLNNSMEGFGYVNDFVFERDPVSNNITWIKAARMRGFYNPLSNTSDYVKAMVDVRRKIDMVPEVPAFSSSYFYIFYEQFLDIANQYILMLVFTLLAIFLVTLIFMGFKTAIIVCFCVLMIHLDMLGLAANFGVMLNAVSAVNAVAIMGLADEYVNYVMRAFELEDGTPVERIESALLQYFRPVTNAAVSTLIGVVPLAFARSAAYRVYYFRMFFIATLLSWLTGIVFLPTSLLAMHGVGITAPLARWIDRRFLKKKEKGSDVALDKQANGENGVENGHENGYLQEGANGDDAAADVAEKGTA